MVDSHLGLPRVDDPRALVEERDLAPFAAVVDAGVRCVTTAHVVFTAYDPDIDRKLKDQRREQTQEVLQGPDPRPTPSR